MPKPKSVFEYDYEAVAKLSDWPPNRLFQDQTRGTINIESLASIAVWLAQNGKPRLRAEMASKLLADLMEDGDDSPGLLTTMFERAAKARKATGRRRGKRA